MQLKRLIQIGGVISFLFVIVHLSFWNLFDWHQDLVSLSSDNRAIMQVLNIHIAYVLLIFAIISIIFPEELGASKFGRFIGLAIAFNWVLRAINQIIFWGIAAIDTWVAVFICLVIALLYAIPIFSLRRT